MATHRAQTLAQDCSVLGIYIEQARSAIRVRAVMTLVLAVAVGAFVSVLDATIMAVSQFALFGLLLWALSSAAEDGDDLRATRRLSTQAALIGGLGFANLSWLAMSIRDHTALHLGSEASLFLIAILIFGALQVHLSILGYALSVAPPLMALMYVAFTQAHGLDERLGFCIALFAVAIIVTTWRQQASNRSLSKLRVDLTRKNSTLAEAVRLTQLAEEATLVGYWRVDVATRTLSWSKQVFAIHGLEPTALQPSAEGALDWFHPDDRSNVRLSMRQALSSGQAFDIQGRIVRKDGETRYVVCRGTSDRNAVGVLTSVFGTFMDVTDLKLADASLRDSEARLRQLTENASDIIVQSNLQGQVIYASPACKFVTGFEPSDILGLYGDQYVHPEDFPQLNAVFSNLLKSDGAERRTFEMRIRKRNGGWAWVESKAWLGRDPHSGAPIEFCDIVRDISARKALDEELARAREASAAAIETKTEFLANMSHEIRTPLTSIIGFSKLLSDRKDLTPEAEGQVARIETAGRALLGIVNDILDFSKLEAGQVQLEQQSFDCRDLVQEVANLSEPQLLGRDVALVIEHAETLPARVVNDPTRLRQVLVNLVSNAIKFTAAGTVVIRTAYGVDDNDRSILRVEVEDTGVGIPPEKLHRMFGRFSQADGSITRAYGGTGLGLAICKGIIELLNGKIGVESVAGQGSVFWFEIPAVEGSLEVDDDHQLFTDEPDIAEKRILVVDDVTVNRELVKAMLSPLGPTIVEAASGEDALSILECQSFDLILMDVQMPGMSGLEATREIRRRGLCNLCPVVAMTANHLPEQIAACLAAGMSAHISKPFVPAQLLSTIFHWISATDKPQADEVAA